MRLLCDSLLGPSTALRIQQRRPPKVCSSNVKICDPTLIEDPALDCTCRSVTTLGFIFAIRPTRVNSVRTSL